MKNIRLDMNNKQKSLEMIYEHTYAKAYVIARQFVKNEEDALDIVQEAYISVFNHMESLKDESKLDKWVNMIVANRCKDWLRKKQVVLFSDMGEDENSDYEETLENDNVEFLPEESADYAETKRLMSEILAGLPEDQRMCVLMYYYDELSVNEIAESLECSTGTVKSRLNYARKKIKNEVEALERNGTKLYGIAPLPFIVWMLKETETHAASALNHTTIVQSAMGIGTGTMGKVGMLKRVANVGGKVIAHSVRNKVLVSVLAIGLIGGGMCVGYTYLQNQKNTLENNSDEVVILKEEGKENKTDKKESKKKLTEEDYLDAYQDVLLLEEYKYYAFVDLDGKGMPELLLGKKEDSLEQEGESVQMHRATLYKYTESGSEELETIGGVTYGFTLMYSAKEKQMGYTTMKSNGAYYVASIYFNLNSNGELEKTVLGVNEETMQYYYGEEMDNPKFEISKSEYNKYQKALGDTKEIIFKKINKIKYQVQYIDDVYQTIEENLGSYQTRDVQNVHYYNSPDSVFCKMVFQLPEDMSKIEGAEDCIAECYIDCTELEIDITVNSDGREVKRIDYRQGNKNSIFDWMVLMVVTNTKTGEVYRYYQYDQELIRYVHCNQEIQDYEKGRCLVDRTTVAYPLYEWVIGK